MQRDGHDDLVVVFDWKERTKLEDYLAQIRFYFNVLDENGKVVCTCEPYHEYDTNVTMHDPGCLLELSDSADACLNYTRGMLVEKGVVR